MAKEFSGSVPEENITSPGTGNLKALTIKCDKPVCTKSTVIQVLGSNEEDFKLIPIYNSSDKTPQIVITSNRTNYNSSSFTVEFMEEGQVKVCAVPSSFPKNYALFTELPSISNYSPSLSISCSKPSSFSSNNSDSFNSSLRSVDRNYTAVNNISKCFPPPTKRNQQPEYNLVKASEHESQYSTTRQVNQLYGLVGVAFDSKDNHANNDLFAITNWLKSLTPPAAHKYSVDSLKGYKTQLDLANNNWNVWVQDFKNLYSSGKHVETFQSFISNTYSSTFNAKRDFSVNTQLFYVNSSNTTFKSSCFVTISDLNRVNSQYKWESVDNLYTVRTATKIDYCSEGYYQYLNKHYIKCDNEIVTSATSKSEDITVSASLKTTTFNTFCRKDYTVRANQLIYQQSNKDLYSIAKKDSKYVSGGEAFYSSKDSTTIVSGGETYITSYKDIQVSATNILALDGSTVRIGMGAARKVIYDMDNNKYNVESEPEPTGLPPSNSSPTQAATTEAVTDPNVPNQSIPNGPSPNKSSIDKQNELSAIEKIVSPEAISSATKGDPGPAIQQLQSKGITFATSTFSKLFSKTDKPKPSPPPSPPVVIKPSDPVKPSKIV